MNRYDPKVLALTGVLIVFGLTINIVRPMIAAPGQKALLHEVFHLPDDVEMEFDGDVGGRNSLHEAAGVVTFTPAQYAAWRDTLGDRSIWKPAPIEFGGYTFDGHWDPDALRWVTGLEPICEPTPCFWLDWNDHIHEDVYAVHSGRRRSLCFVAMEDGDAYDMRPCHERGDHRAELLVRGALDTEDQKLYIYIRRM